MAKKYRLLLITILVLTAIRFFWLGMFPPGLSNDETEYMLSAKTYADYGRDVSGYGLPLSLFKSETDDVIAPIPSVLSAPVFWFLPLNPDTARIPYVIISLLTAVGVYKLSFVLFKNKTGSLITTIVFLISPWSFYLSRNTADSPFALLFYLWGTYFLLKAKGKNLIIPFVLFSFGFFSYHGAKTLLIPLIFVVLYYRSFIARSLSLKQAVVFQTAALLLFLSFVFIAKSIPGSVLSERASDVILNQSEISRLVDETRRQSIASPFQNIFINKFVVGARTLTERYLGVFDPATLFLRGDLRATYRFGGYGLFHIVDIVFLIIGFAYLAKKKAKELVLLILILAVSPIATMLSGVETSVINRSFMLLPVFLILIGQGIFFISNFKSVFKFAAVALVLLSLATSFVYFLHFYFFSFPVTAQENYWVGDRALVSYLSRQNKAVWITNEPWNAMMRIIFYSGDVTKDEYLAKTYPLNQKTSYSFINTTITNACPVSLDSDTVYAISSRINCHNEVKPDMTIFDAKDSGDLVRIINGNCKEVNLASYRRFNLISDYSIENMDLAQLCKSWFIKKD